MAKKRVSTRTGARPYGPRGDPKASFLKFVEPSPTGCHIWTGTTSGVAAGGHGSFWFRGRMERAHRVAWILSQGEIPDGLNVLHRCDVPPCVNPDHLFLGTQRDNIDDMVSKGRQQRRPGEANRSAKLMLLKVAEIKRRYADGGVTFRALGADYGVCEATVSHIINGRTWKCAA